MVKAKLESSPAVKQNNKKVFFLGEARGCGYKVPVCMLLSSGVEEGRCANHKCTRTATAQGSRMSASLRMDGALHSAGAAFSFRGAEPLPEPHGAVRCEPLRVCASFQLRSSPPGSHHCLMSASAARRDRPMVDEEPRRGAPWEMEFDAL